MMHIAQDGVFFPSKALCIDVLQTGVGGIDSWGNKPLAEQMIGAQQEATWAFQLLPGGKVAGDQTWEAGKYPPVI